jgi:hypothetical protein
MKLAHVTRLIGCFALTLTICLSQSADAKIEPLIPHFLAKHLPDGSTKESPKPESGAAYATTTTLSVPANAVVGQKLTLSAHVVAEHGPIPSGYVTFYKEGQNIGQATLDIQGNASLPASGLTLGTYFFTARYTSSGDESPSQSSSQMVTIYQAPPDMALSLSTRSVQVAYGTSSEPVILQVASRYGLAGNIELSCSGLPAGMVCEFMPEQLPLAADGVAAASFIVGNIPAKKQSLSHIAGMTAVGLVALLGIAMLGRKKRRTSVRLVGAFALLIFSPLSGCGGHTASSNIRELETGPRTILVNATVGDVTRSITLLLEVRQ